MSEAWRVTIKRLVTHETVLTRDFPTRPAAMRYAKVAVRTNTEASVSKVKKPLVVLLTPDI